MDTDTTNVSDFSVLLIWKETKDTCTVLADVMRIQNHVQLWAGSEADKQLNIMLLLVHSLPPKYLVMNHKKM